jgi:hypothetical protein
MRIGNAVWVALGIVLLTLTTSLAVYYRGQARHFEGQWSWAVAQLGKMPAVPAAAPSFHVPTPEPRPKPAAVSNATPAIVQRPAVEAQAEPGAVPAPAFVAAAPPAPDGQRGGRRGADWLSNLRTNDPQRYEEMQQRRKDFEERVQSAWARSTNYFMSRDTSKMSEPDLQDYSRMISLLDETRTLSDRLQSGVAPEERRQMFAAVRSNMVALTPLLDNERNKEYYDLAVAMGSDEKRAAEFVGYVNQIASNTSVRNIFPALGRGGPGGPGGGPGGGRQGSGRGGN